MDHYQFLFEHIEEEQKDILIALLGNIGFNGFEEKENSLKAFIQIPHFIEADFQKIIDFNKAVFSVTIISETNWNAEWEKGFSPVIILNPVTEKPFVCIRAVFHEPLPGALHDILITPKMSFGTGHHATTCLMIEQMSQMAFCGKTVIDFGTGTGVLAILAEKLGAKEILAIDHDDWSIGNARENIEANQCMSITLNKSDNIRVSKKADIILANINLNIILDHLKAICSAAEPVAIILLSGVLTYDQDNLLQAISDNSLAVVNCFYKDNWIAILAKNADA